MLLLFFIIIHSQGNAMYLCCVFHQSFHDKSTKTPDWPHRCPQLTGRISIGSGIKTATGGRRQN
jgi:hypothetical protein